MRRWLLISFGVLMAAIAASLVVWWKEPLNWKEPWNKDSIYWLTDVRGYVITQERERTLKRKDTFKECKACPEMVVVPAGEFMMGWPETQKRYSDNEGPQHKVMISRPYAVARFELTFAEWDACADHGDCPRDIAASGSSRPRLPVINVSWDDAQRYVAWLSKITGKPYRLLSEAEWEYAARAGATTRYSFGDDEAMLDQYAWYSGNSINRVHPVGLKTPNAFGVFDMHGNVWEWVADCYHDDYEGAPVDGAPGRRAGARRVSFAAVPGTTVRGSSAPPIASGTTTVDRQYFFGFRVGRTLKHDPEKWEPVFGKDHAQTKR